MRGIYHTNSPEVISIFTRQSVLHTSHLENSWLLPIIHKWRLTFRLGRGHIHYVEKYHLLMKQWHPPPPQCSAYAYWTASRAHCKREGPGWHDVYCTSIWCWCILRCKQGFKLYAPPCQWLRLALAICLSAGGWEECPSRYAPARTCAGVMVFFFFGLCLCAWPHSHASIRATCSISTPPCPVDSPQMLIAALQSHHRDLTACWCLTQTLPCSASNLGIQPL